MPVVSLEPESLWWQTVTLTIRLPGILHYEYTPSYKQFTAEQIPLAIPLWVSYSADQPSRQSNRI